MTVWKPTAKYYLSVLFNKRNRSLCHRRCNTLKWQTNVKLDWTDVCLFYVLFCSYVLLSKQGMHPLKQHSARDTSSLTRIRDLIFMCYTVQTRISATIIIRFLVPARNDEVEATVTTLSYNSYVLYLRIHAPTKNYTRPAIRHPWQGPGTLSSCAIRCRPG